MTAESAPRATGPAEVTNAAAFLHAATVGGHLEMDEHAEANGGASVRHQLDPLPAPYPPVVVDFVAALDRLVTGTRSAADEETLRPLRGKQMLFVGDSTDGNLWSRLCHCTRRTASGLAVAEAAVGSERAIAQDVRCFDSARPGDLSSCTFPTLNLSLHFAASEFGVHPFGRIKWHPVDYMPVCPPNALSVCLHKKLHSLRNSRYSIKQWGQTRSPDLVTVHLNFWLEHSYSFRAVKAERVASWSDLMRSYRHNFTVFVRSLREVLPTVGLWATHTSIIGQGPVPSPAMTEHVNAALREVAVREHLACADWQLMAHAGWTRRQAVLYDGRHARLSINSALGNIYLNALAIIPFS